MRSLLLAAALVAASLGVAAAEPVVLAIDGDAIYVDLGAKDGVGEGTTLELLHEVVVRDPRTNAVLRDRFALGTLTVEKSGDHLSVAHGDGELGKRVVVGDHVRLASATRTFTDPWAEQVAASKRAPTPDTPEPEPIAPTPTTDPVDHLGLVGHAWEDTLGHRPEERIERWTALLAADPKTPYRRVIEQEIASLRAQLAERAAVVAKARSAARVDREPRIAQLAKLIDVEREDLDALIVAAPIARATPGRDLEMSFLVRAPSSVERGVLFVRPAGDPGFRRIELVADGDANLRGTIDRALVHGSKLEWYVETITRDHHEVIATLGSQAAPRTIAIDPVVAEAPVARHRSHIDAHVDYVDFDGNFAKGYDQYYQAEFDFTYRFLEPIHAVRLGFGTLSGIGGPKDVIDDARAAGRAGCTDGGGTYRCREVTFSYVYLEFEHRIRPNVAIMLRPQSGLLTTDRMADPSAGRCKGANHDGCDFVTGVGARGRVRLGDEDGTNLVLGVGFTTHVGTVFEAAYHWLPSKLVPVQLAVQVTDMPVVENFGVRLIADVGLRHLTWFYPSVRLSYQARDIDHQGVSGGFAMNFDW